MSRVIKILGDVNNKGQFQISVNKTVKEILTEYAGGMKKSRKVKLVQIGGPLGVCIKGKDLNNKLNEYEKCMTGDMIIFLSDLLCPVDYLRFLTRFMVRELRIDNKHIRKLNELIENIAQGKATKEDYQELINEVNKDAETNAEDALHKIFRYITTEFQNEFIEHIVDKHCKNGICRGLMVTQCMNACPAEVYIPGYIELMKYDKVEEAYSLMRKNNPLSFVCGKVCSRPCEDRCRRGEIESTVGVRALKRYAADMALKMNSYKEDKLDSNGKKIAIVGAGPAGLTAAYYLARTGYEVVIYEAEKKAGGMLAVGIPEYRLPQETIDKEVELIKDLGVEIRTNTRVGQDIALKELREKFDAVLLATGCHIGKVISGTEAEGVEAAVKLLKEVKAEGRKKIGENVLVIGGGDVAIDAARTTVRLGGKSVKIASLEEFDIMPANDDEKEEAIEEGIEFLCGYGIEEVNNENGKVTGVTLKKCISVFDEEYKFSPQFDENDIKTLEIDSLIFAIGQKPDLNFIDEDINTTNRGFIEIDQYTFKTSAEGVFATGDMNRPGAAINAIADAKKAAEEIDKYLNGNGLYIGEDIAVPERSLKVTTWDDERVKETIDCPEKRKSNFGEVGKTFSIDEAKFEASRCMRCDRNSRRPLYLK